MAEVSHTIGVGVRGPIRPGTYQVGRKRIQVSYPPILNLDFTTIELPKSLSTLFVVSWEDKGGKVAAKLQSQSFERHLPVYEALTAVSELLLAFKLVRIGHSDGRGLRTIGIGDTLVHFSAIDGVPTGNLNLGLKNYDGNNAWTVIVRPRPILTSASIRRRRGDEVGRRRPASFDHRSRVSPCAG